MKKISNKTEFVVIFEKIDGSDVTCFHPIDVVIGHADIKRKVFVTEKNEEYPFIFDTKEKYSFGLRNKIGVLNSIYHEKKLKTLLDKYLIELSQYIYFFGNIVDSNEKGLQFLCEDLYGNIFCLSDRDFESYKKHQLKEKNCSTDINVHVDINIKELICEVKKKVIGQDNAIEDVASILWENYKGERKQNILLVGPTGVGKTEIMRLMSKKLGIPMIVANMASITQNGYQGESVEDVLRSLIQICGNDVKKAENGIIVLDEIDKLAKTHTGGEVATTGVQDELLKLVDDGLYLINMSNDLLVRNEVVFHTKNITFVGLGAFSELFKERKRAAQHLSKVGFNVVPSNEDGKGNDKVTTDDLVKYGLKEELVGRFSNIIELNALNKEHLMEIMKNPNIDFIRSKINLLNSVGVSVNIKDSVYEKLANMAIAKNTGARGLIGAIDRLFVKAIVEIAENDGVYDSLTIDDHTVDNPKHYVLTKKKDGHK